MRLRLFEFALLVKSAMWLVIRLLPRHWAYREICREAVISVLRDAGEMSCLDLLDAVEDVTGVRVPAMRQIETAVAIIALSKEGVIKEWVVDDEPYLKLSGRRGRRKSRLVKPHEVKFVWARAAT